LTAFAPYTCIGGANPLDRYNLPIFMEFARKPKPRALSCRRIVFNGYGLFLRNRPLPEVRYNLGTKPNGGFPVNITLKCSSVFLVVASLAIGFPAAAHGPSGHHEAATAAQDEEAMKAQHARMRNFEEAVAALGKALIHADKPGAEKYAGRLTEALRGHERDVPHKNVSRAKEFQAFFKELKGRAEKLAVDAGTGNLQKTSLAYGRVLEVCVSCHAKFRD
jgi:cytochrome c556